MLMAGLLLVPLTLLAAAPAADTQDGPALPEWMAGCWIDQTPAGWTEECWMPPRGGMMLGASRSGAGDAVAAWEMLRIETQAENGDGPPIRMAYSAAPMGRGWTTFAWSPGIGPGLSFYNTANDYPQRIRYWREGAVLNAEIAMADGSRARRWRYSPVRR